jgi:5-methylcytosine-specific restriction endonuclease McrA
LPRSTQRTLEGPNCFNDDVLQFCAAAYGFEVRQKDKDTGHASQISHKKAILPRNIHRDLFIFLHCDRHKKSWIGFWTISAGLFGGVVTTQQHFPGEAKESRGWQCERCKINLAAHKEFLHTHHRNGVKGYNSIENFVNLCVRCHAKEPSHGHLRFNPDYGRFIQTFRKSNGSNRIVAAAVSSL